MEIDRTAHRVRSTLAVSWLYSKRYFDRRVRLIFSNTNLNNKKKKETTCFKKFKNLLPPFRYLRLSISEASIRKQYRFTIISAITDGNTRNVDYVLAFVEKNVQTIIKRYFLILSYRLSKNFIVINIPLIPLQKGTRFFEQNNYRDR